MKYFLQRTFLFFSPIVIVGAIFLSIPIYTIFSTGEHLKVSEIIYRQQKDKSIIVGISLRNIDSSLKFHTTELKQPDILALGTSRVLQFRETFFKDDVSFYNAGRGFSNLNQCIQFLEELNYQPKIIILGLDQDLFHQQYAEDHQESLVISNDHARWSGILGKSIEESYSDGMILNDLNNYPKNVGLNGVTYGEGFRSDGSYFYNRILNHPELEITKRMGYPFQSTIEAIESGKGRFQYGNNMYMESLDQIRKILEICSDRNIKIVSFIPPFAPLVYSKMINSGKYLYIEEIYTELQPIFNHFSFELYDFTDFSKHSKDKMYIDGFHGGEEVYKNILSVMKNHGSILSEFIQL